MGTLRPLPHRRIILLGLCAALLLMTCRVPGAATLAALVGTTECLDCAQKSIKNENAFKGLRVAIKCKVSNEHYDTKAAGELDRQGSFAVKLPSKLLMDNGELKHECLAQLHSTPNAPCSDPSKIILKSNENGKHTFIVAAAAGKLSFSSATCVAVTFWRPYKDGPWHNFPMYPLPPFKFPPKPFFHPHPIYWPPAHEPPSSRGSHYNPPAAPVYKKPTPAYKPPSSGGHYEPPSSGRHYKPPSSGGYYKPPSSGGHYEPPSSGRHYKPPSSGGYYKPPSSGEHYEPPSSGRHYKPPSSGGYYKPPSSGGHYKPPSSGGHYKPPSPGGYYKPPAPVNKPPSGGYYKPPASAYKPTPEPHYKHPYRPIIFKKPWPPIPQLPPFYHPQPKFYFPPIYKKPLPELPGWPPYSQWHKYFSQPGKPGYPPAKVHHRKP